MTTIISICGSGKCGLVASSSERGGDQFDGIATEDHQVANVLFQRAFVPGVVGIGLGPVNRVGVRAAGIAARFATLKSSGSVTAPDLMREVAQ